MYLLRPFFRNGRILCTAALITPTKVDTSSSTSQTTTTVTKESTSTRLDRVYKIFTFDEFGDLTPELTTILQTTFFTAFAGACYGGFIQSRDAYLKFIERNQATHFTDHFDAKKKLQDFVTVNFAKGALKWSWRLALFGGMYITFITVLSAYRGKASLFEYTVGGMLAGGVYQMKMGLRGAIVGSTLGAMIGLFAGSLSLTIFRLTGTSYDDFYNWHSEISEARLRHESEAAQKRENQKLKEYLMKSVKES